MPRKSGEGAVSSEYKQAYAIFNPGGIYKSSSPLQQKSMRMEPWSCSGSPSDVFFLASTKHRDPSIETGNIKDLLSHMPPSLDGHMSETKTAKAQVPAIIASSAAM